MEKVLNTEVSLSPSSNGDTLMLDNCLRQCGILAKRLKSAPGDNSSPVPFPGFLSADFE